MKNTILIFCLFFGLTTIMNAQSNRFKRPRQSTPQQEFVIRPNCSDLAAFLKVEKLKNSNSRGGTIKITATIKNIGRKNYADKYTPIKASLVASPNNRLRYEPSSMTIRSLKAGESKVIYMTIPWTVWPDVPNFKLCIDHNSRSHLDRNPYNDDCNSRNNCASLSGQEINRLFRR